MQHLLRMSLFDSRQLPFIGQRIKYLLDAHPYPSSLFHPLPLMPLPNLSRQCTATCRATGCQCRNPAAYGMATCRFHGARKPASVRKGEDHPQYRHGWRSQAGIQEYREASARLIELEGMIRGHRMLRWTCAKDRNMSK